MIESLLGGVFGGLLRLAPEVLKWLDRKDERKHELAMLDKELAMAQLRVTQAMHTADASVEVAQFEAIASALKGQASMARSGGKVVSAISALVRPLVTYWVVALWSAVKIASMVLAYQTGGDWKAMLLSNWSADDNAIMSLLLSFWFVGRIWERHASR